MKRPYRLTSEDFLRARKNGATCVENRFISDLRLQNGVYKTTGPGRLEDTHEAAASALRGMRASVLRVLDVGCSSGISTVELHRALESKGLKVETVGTDLLLQATLVEDSTAKCLFTGRGHLTQVETRGWALRWPLRWSDWLKRPVRVLLVLALLAARDKAYRACLSGPREGFRVTTIPLTSGMTESIPGLSMVEEDMLQPADLGKFHFIRAANVLNRVYFSPVVLQNACASLWSRLMPGAMLLVIRSDRECNRGTLFARSEGETSIVARLGAGSDIEEIVIRASRQAPRTTQAGVR